MRDGFADWDDGRCPVCGAGTLRVTIDGVHYRHCSFATCVWGLDGHDEIVNESATEARAALERAKENQK